MKDLEDFSQAMFSIIGDKWGEWGGEQTMSNVLVANAPRMGLLIQLITTTGVLKNRSRSSSILSVPIDTMVASTSVRYRQRWRNCGEASLSKPGEVC